MVETSDEVVELGTFPHRTTVAAKGREISRLLENQPLFAGKPVELVRITHSTHSALLEYKNPDNGSDTPLLVKYIMISSGAQKAADTVRREFTALETARSLAGTDFSESIPNPLLVLPEAGLMVTKKLGGVALSYVLRRNANWMFAPFRTGRLREIAYNVGLWLVRFHQATRQPDIPLDAGAFESEILQQLEGCKRKGLSIAAAQEVFRVASRCSRRIEGRPLPAACRHGDFTARNILLDGQQIRILDFENFAKSDTAYEDVGKFLAYVALLQGKPGYSRGALTAVRKSFLHGYGDSLENHIIDLFAMKAATRMMAHRGMGRVSSLWPVDSLYVRQYMKVCASTDAGFNRLHSAPGCR
jgi:Phosphotransferase enzyme family